MSNELVNADFTQRVVIETDTLPWVPSPQAGVERRLLDRIGGEEIFLLSGSLRDEYGSYGAGAWIRNPAGFRRRLSSPDGATYWVKRGHLHPIS